SRWRRTRSQRLCGESAGTRLWSRSNRRRRLGPDRHACPSARRGRARRQRDGPAGARGAGADGGGRAVGGRFAPHPAWGTRGAGRRDGAFRRGPLRCARGPRRPLRRTLHHDSRRAGCRRGCPGGGAPVDELSGMVEEPPTLTPPARRHRAKPSRRRLLVRRLVALGFLLALVALVAGSAWAILGGREAAATQPLPPPPPPKPLRIIFPEGFTRTDMAERIREVNQIAREKRHVQPRLSAQRYLALTEGSSKVPRAFLGQERPPDLEGFLFPATYEF